MYVWETHFKRQVWETI